MVWIEPLVHPETPSRALDAARFVAQRSFPENKAEEAAAVMTQEERIRSSGLIVSSN